MLIAVLSPIFSLTIDSYNLLNFIKAQYHHIMFKTSSTFLLSSFCSIILSFLITSSVFGQTTVESLEHDGVTRSYRLHLPPNFDPQESLPVVFNLHGFTSNAFQQEAYSEMNMVADSARFIVCYPDGIGNAWNVGWNFGSTADDIGFISAMIDEFAENYNINTNRVYSCGMSNGGFMSYHLACNLSDKIAAVASVTGSMVPGNLGDCTPEIARPIMEIHGTADATVPYGGAANIALPIEVVVNHWVMANDCLLVTDTTDYPDINTGDNSTASRIDYSDCEGDKMVSFIKIFNGGHTWPGASITFIGTTNQDFNASSTIWNFFNRFSIDETTAIDPEFDDFSMVLYPNPTSDFLNLKLAEGESGFGFPLAYKIIGTDGQTYHRNRISQNTSSIDIRDLATGVYFIVLENQKPLKFVKF